VSRGAAANSTITANAAQKIDKHFRMRERETTRFLFTRKTILCFKLLIFAKGEKSSFLALRDRLD
jgi:hypothetical protein